MLIYAKYFHVCTRGYFRTNSSISEVLRSLASLFSCVLLCVCDCVCVQGLTLHQGTRLVDPEAGDFKRAALPAHEELTLAFAVVA